MNKGTIRTAVAVIAVSLLHTCHCGEEPEEGAKLVTGAEPWYEAAQAPAEQPPAAEDRLEEWNAVRKEALAQYRAEPCHKTRLRLAAAYFQDLAAHFEGAQTTDFRLSSEGISAEYEVSRTAAGLDGSSWASPGKEKRLTAQLPLQACEPFVLSSAGHLLNVRRLNGTCEVAQPGILRGTAIFLPASCSMTPALRMHGVP